MQGLSGNAAGEIERIERIVKLRVLSNHLQLMGRCDDTASPTLNELHSILCHRNDSSILGRALVWKALAAYSHLVEYPVIFAHHVLSTAATSQLLPVLSCTVRYPQLDSHLVDSIATNAMYE